MKAQIRKLNEEELLGDFPIKGKAANWYFRLIEVSNGYWKIEGKDKWGRMISLTGGDDTKLIEMAEEGAARINDNTSAT